MFRQMEKLIELLNEYETPQSWVVFKSYDNYDGTFYWVDCDWETEIAWSDSLICSNKFWFIKWLVENEKIDLEKVKGKIWIPCFVWYTEWEISCVNDKEDYEQLLMLLSIQDEPINFLISILK